MALLEASASSMQMQEPVTGLNGHAELLQRLDQLHETYLGLLHDYTEARSRLSQSFSQGFLSLAQANFTAPNRMRYGRDYYDDRMQALRTVEVQEPGVQMQVKDSQEASSNKSSLATSKEEDADDEDAEKMRAQGSRDDDGDAEAEGGKKKAEDGEESSKEDDDKGSKQRAPVDPIRWFGVLVPRGLRDTQRRFVDATQTAVPELVSVDRQMRELEIEIRRTKKRLGKVEAKR